MIEKTADSLLLSKHSIQFSALFLLLSAATYGSKELSNFLYDHIVVHIKFASAKIDVNELGLRYTFYDRLAKLGGALGLCCQMTGASLLTMIHLFVLITKAFWNCYATRA